MCGLMSIERWSQPSVLALHGNKELNLFLLQIQEYQQAKMSNEPPPPYPGGPTAPLLEEKSGAPLTPGKDVKLSLVEVG